MCISKAVNDIFLLKSALSSGVFLVGEEQPSCHVLTRYINSWQHMYLTPLSPIPLNDFVFEFLTKIFYLLLVFSCFLHL